MREFVARFGCPLEIDTDQGRHFESQLFKEMCELVKQEPQATDHLRMIKLNDILDRSHRNAEEIR